MKKFTLQFLLTAVFIFMNAGLFAQTNKNTNEEVPLKPLFELFTSSTCAPCAYANPTFDALLEDNPGTHSVIKYQVNYPGSGDPYYTAEIGARNSYYSITGVPSLCVNSDQMHPNDCTQEVYDSYQPNTTSIDIEIISAEIDLANNLSVEVDINALAEYDAGLKAHIAIVEKTTVGNIGNNGELEFHFVMMKMLPGADGTTLPALSNGNTETLEFTFDMSTTNMEDANDLEIIAFVQNDTDKSILQSEQGPVESELDDYIVTFNVMDNNMASVEGAEMFLENYGTKFSDENGLIVYDGVLPGSYDYSVIAAGLLSTEGTVEVLADDVTVDVVMEIPAYYYYQDFTDGIPESYTIHSGASGDYLYAAAGGVIFFRQSGTDTPLMLVTEQIDIIPGEKIFFDVGEDSGFPFELVFGIVSDPNDPETFTEVATIVPTTEWETYEYLLEDLPTEDTDLYFAWYHSGANGTFCTLDNIKINYGGGSSTYAVNFSIVDDEANPVEGAEVSLEGNGSQVSDASGMVNFVDIEAGTYTYTSTKEGYETVDGSITVVDGDVSESVEMIPIIYYYSINFTVIDGSTSLDGADITINGETQTTNATGLAVFSNMEDGSYTYTVSLNGFEAYDDQVIVNGEDVDVEVNLVIDGLVNQVATSLIVYPNPASEIINISLDREIENISIYSIDGKLLNSYNIKNPQCQIDVSNYEKGMYLLRIVTSDYMISKNVVIK